MIADVLNILLFPFCNKFTIVTIFGVFCVNAHKIYGFFVCIVHWPTLFQCTKHAWNVKYCTYIDDTFSSGGQRVR